MNNKGQAGLAIISAVMIFMVGMVVVNIIKPDITTFRASDAMDCSNSSANKSAPQITDGAKLTCLVGDLVVPYFIVIILSLAGGLVVDRLIGGGSAK